MSIETRKLHEMPYAQAKILTDGKSYQLWSYNTCVAFIDCKGWLIITGLYSVTTRRHIGAFMREFGFDYQTAKQLFTDNMSMNIYSGECRKRH